jgi:hypothetical protein
MVEFKREFFLKDHVFGELFDLIKRRHKVADHTIRVLKENRHIEDFCEEARHFVLLPGQNPVFLHYDVTSWLLNGSNVKIRIDSIGVYDDELEYTIARQKGIHSEGDASFAERN